MDNDELDIDNEAWRSQEWRLNHLYWIEQKNGPPCRFSMNWAQRELFSSLHTRNNILKARQLGMSTLTALLILDNCLFNRNFHAGIIDKTLYDAQEKLGKIKFAVNYIQNLPDNDTCSPIDRFARLAVNAMAPQFSATHAQFANGSDIRIGTSLRGGTLQFLHVSEFGHVAANFPQKALEVISGSLNTVSSNGVVIMESTHEGGKFGENYRMTKRAMENVGKNLSPLDFRFFFFPWWKQPEYRVESGEPLRLDQELTDYFQSLADDGILLDEAQRRWYASQSAAFGPLVKQEYPSTPDEAFFSRVEGSIYGSLIARLRAEGRMAGDFEPDPDAPAYVSWDIGLADNMALWLIQPTASGRFLVLDHYTANNKDLDHFIGICRSWEALVHQNIALHLLPHDSSQRDKATNISFQDHFNRMRLPSCCVPKTPDIWSAIDITRRFLRYCLFHARCSEPVVVDGIEYLSGVNALENYQTAPMGRNGVERKQPLHNACSHAADALRTFAQAWHAGFVGRETVAPSQTRAQARLAKPSRKGLAKGVPWG